MFIDPYGFHASDADDYLPLPDTMVTLDPASAALACCKPVFPAV